MSKKWSNFFFVVGLDVNMCLQCQGLIGEQKFEIFLDPLHQRESDGATEVHFGLVEQFLLDRLLNIDPPLSGKIEHIRYLKLAPIKICCNERDSVNVG